MPDHEAAGRGEHVDMLQMLLHPHLAQKELLGRRVGKALVAAHGRCARAQRSVGLAQHLAIGCANDHELMQGEHDSRIGQHAPGQGDHVDPQQHEMVEVHHVRGKQPQEFRIGFQQQAVGRLVPPVVILTAQEQELVRTSIKTRDPRTALVKRRLRLVHDREQGHVHIVPLLQALKQLVADLLRTTADKLRVEDADKQDLHAAPFFVARARPKADR